MNALNPETLLTDSHNIDLDGYFIKIGEQFLPIKLISKASGYVRRNYAYEVIVKGVPKPVSRFWLKADDFIYKAD